MWREEREAKPYFRTQEKSITRYHTGLSTRYYHYQYGIQCLAIGDRENIVKNRKKWCRGIEVEQVDELDEAKHGSNIYKETKPQNVGFSKKFTFTGTWRQVFICLRPPLLLGFVWGSKAIL
jgi:hypothetical protein